MTDERSVKVIKARRQYKLAHAHNLKSKDRDAADVLGRLFMREA